MRYGIVSDIHSNLVALEAVLEQLDAMNVDRLLCLGDIVGYGPQPNECCEVLKARGCIAIAGNHDEAAVLTSSSERFNSLAARAIEWTRQELTPENREYLRNLPRERQFESFDIVHGAPEEHFNYIVGLTDACAAFEKVRKPVTFIGHTHVAEVFFQEYQAGGKPSGGLDSARTFHQRLANGGRIEVVSQYRYIVNPGSVGQPRDRNPQASFAVFDDGLNVIDVRRASYDIAGVRKKMESARLPVELAERLGLGY